MEKHLILVANHLNALLQFVILNNEFGVYLGLEEHNNDYLIFKDYYFKTNCYKSCNKNKVAMDEEEKGGEGGGSIHKLITYLYSIYK